MICIAKPFKMIFRSGDIADSNPHAILWSIRRKAMADLAPVFLERSSFKVSQK
jgi:hypothetical protein